MNRTDTRYEHGKALLAEGHYPEAAAVFEQLAAEMPKFKKAWEKLALTYLNLDRIADAVHCYDEILIRYPKDSFTLYQKSVLEEKSGNFDKALDSVNKALKAEPENAEYLYFKGFLFFRKQQINDAISWFDRSLEVDPFHFHSADYKCLCLMTLGIYDELISSAVEYVSRFQDMVIDSNKTDENNDDHHEHGGELFGKEFSEIKKEDLWRLFNYLSFSYMKLGAFKQAEEILLRELEFDFEKSRVYYYLGLVQNALGQYEKAASSYEASLLEDPNLTPSRLNLGLVLSKAAEKESDISDGAAVNLSDRAVELYQKSLFALEQILSIEPENLTVLYEIGKIYSALGDIKKAETLFSGILQLDASFVPVYEHLAKMKLNEGNYEAALSFLSEAQIKDPFNYEVMNMTGVIYSRKGDNDFALKCLNRAEMLDPFNPKAHYNKALIFLKENEYEKAADSLSKVTEADAVKNGIPYEKVLNFYGTALLNLGKREEALVVFEQLLVFKPNDTDVLETILDLKVKY
jgi:Flp pilus assembly protein TadD, contains TPR repeats